MAAKSGNGTSDPPFRHDRGVKGPPIRLLVWLVVLLAAAFFMTVGGTYQVIAINAQIACQVLALTILGGWLIAAIVNPRWRPASRLLVPVLLVAAVYGISALLSQRPRLSLEPTLAGFGYALSFLFLTRLLTERWYRRRFEALLLVGVITIAAAYIVQVVLDWIAWWSLVGRLALPPLRPGFDALIFGTPNLVASFLIVGGPAAVAVIFERTHRRSAAVLMGTVVGLAILLTGSRGGFLGVGVGVLVAGALIATQRGAGVTMSGIRAALTRRPILLLPVVLAVGVIALFGPVIVYRFGQGGDSLRLDLWRSALTIFTQNPLFGAGPGTWVQLKVAANPPGVQNVLVPTAHDMYVQTAAELGIAGLAALVILALAAVRRLLQAWRDGGSANRIHAGAVLVGLAALAGQLIVDNLFNLPFMCLLVIGLVAWIDACSPAERSTVPLPAAPRAGTPRLWTKRTAPLVALAGLCLVIPTFIRIDQASLSDVDGATAALAGDWPAALDAFDAARQRDPGFTLYDIQTAGALARVGRTAEARSLLASAVDSDQVAVVQISLAALEVATQDLASAMKHARTAATLGSNEPTVALNAGIVGEEAGDPAFALDEFANAIAWDPPLARSAFWDTPTRAVAKADIVAAARQRTEPEDAALILAYAGDPGAARAELLGLPISATRDVYLAAADWLSGDLAAAQSRLSDMTARDPLDWFAAAWLSRISRLSGDLASADRYARWAMLVEADAVQKIIAESSVVPAMGDAAQAGVPLNYPWSTYLRPQSASFLAPQLVLIGTR
jgi:O-antigen ligase